MKQPLKRKSVLTIVTVVLISLVVGLSISFAFSNRFYITVKQRSLRQVYNQVNELYAGCDPDIGMDDSGYISLSSICEENNISMLILNPSAKIDFAYGNSAMLYKRLNDIMLSQSDEQVKVIEQSDKYILQSHNGPNRSAGYVEIWGVLDNGDICIARSSYAGISNSVRVSFWFFCFVCVVIFLFVSILVFFILKPYTDSLNRLLVFAQKANKGEFDVEYEENRGHRNDEIGMLGANITEMSHKLEKTISELKTSNLKLEKELKGRIEQVEANKKYMSDVSHELKTPIALISSYAEGIKEGISNSPEERDYYCDVIIDEAEKMNLMVKRLATLNQLENNSNELILERFNLTEVIDGFLNRMAIVIEEKEANIYFDNTVPVYVWSDEFLIEEAFMNFFNNALNHMDDNKIIRINAGYLDDKTVRLTVFNTGSGIDEAEQDKIWDKFYKVDKARTRSYGGSGLGLSIVKAIAESLNQRYGVYNVEDGVAFWIELEAAECTEEEKKKRREFPSAIKKFAELPIWKKTKSAITDRKKKDDGSDKQ